MKVEKQLRTKGIAEVLDAVCEGYVHEATTITVTNEAVMLDVRALAKFKTGSLIEELLSRAPIQPIQITGVFLTDLHQVVSRCLDKGEYLRVVYISKEYKLSMELDSHIKLMGYPVYRTDRISDKEVLFCVAKVPFGNTRVVDKLYLGVTDG